MTVDEHAQWIIGNKTKIMNEDGKEGKQFYPMNFQEVEFIPGLLKVFDEILMNATDNISRSTTKSKSTMSYINVHVLPTGLVTIENDGKGIPITLHKEYSIYIPELIFGHLLSEVKLY